jgi:hypothetical protein
MSASASVRSSAIGSSYAAGVDFATMSTVQTERIFNFVRHELATEPQGVSLDVYDNGLVQLWVGEYKAWLSAEDRADLARLLATLG